MRIFECDRCGACYKQHTGYPKLQMDVRRAYADLCPSCVEELRHWFEDGDPLTFDELRREFEEGGPPTFDEGPEEEEA